MQETSISFLILMATLIDSLPPTLPIQDTLLLQLHAVFGPMLMSALQLVDKREVVRVSLPSDRYIYQVSSSTGKNYTIHIDPPSPLPITPTTLPPPPEFPSSPASTRDKDHVNEHDNEDEIPHTPSPPPSQAFEPLLYSPSNHNDLPRPIKDEEDPIPSTKKEETCRKGRVIKLAKELKKMYCPCAGWGYGCLAGERTILCKHLLAIIIAHKTGKEVKAEVEIGGVAGLLGLS
ncbi:uncharacterized protein IL334_005995 [Kwoniella shivajii]|uniref:SWIM-type domain-containing protein n=1 Tax=Kwoniella shivajii TaxID=564305 RepID=A0ABZ1D5D4_9TREE|nr:hypothetical protein IL334_005995 [Kwoniella shivajii]